MFPYEDLFGCMVKVSMYASNLPQEVVKLIQKE
jgi:hypothetical protein